MYASTDLLGLSVFSNFSGDISLGVCSCNRCEIDSLNGTLL